MWRPGRSVAWVTRATPRRAAARCCRSRSCAGRRRPCCTTTSTVGCAPRPSSSSPARSATTSCPPTDVDELQRLVRGRCRLRVAGALPRDVRPHRRRDADPAPRCAGWRASAPRTWPPTVSSTPRCGSRPSCTWSRGSRCDEVVEAVLDGFADGEAAAAGRGAPDPGRRAAHRDAARGAVAGRSPSWRCAYRDDGVVGFDIAGAEAGYPPTRHLDAFEYMQRRELPLHDPRRRGVRAAVHLGGHAVVRRRPARATACGSSTTSTVGADGDGRARPARRVRPRQADPAGDVPVVQRADRRGAVDRRAPDRPAAPAAVPGHGQHRQPADERHLDDPRDGAAGRGVRLRLDATCSGSRSTR